MHGQRQFRVVDFPEPREARAAYPLAAPGPVCLAAVCFALSHCLLWWFRAKDKTLAALCARARAFIHKFSPNKSIISAQTY